MSDTIAPSSIIHLHDKAFRNAMSDLRIARDFLSHYLPTAILEKVNLQSLILRKETYVDEELKPLIADVLYSVNLIEQPDNSNKAFIYILCEHLSKPDRFAPWRMLK